MTQTEDPNDKLSLAISGKGITVDLMIDRSTFAAIMALVMGADKWVAPSEVAGGSSSAFAGGAFGQQSLREFLDEVRAKRKPDQIVAIGHYLTLSEGQPDFSRDDVKAQFSVARERMPANFPRDFGVAEKAGMLAQVHGKQGRYYVTKTGLAAIQSKFSKDEAK